MTVAPHPPRVAFTSLDEAVETLRRAGCRISAARRVLLEALFAAEGPVSAERLAAGLDGRLLTSDLPSVYRNLERLEKLGVVRHVHLGHGPGLYALAGIEREYLACERCDEVLTVPSGELDLIRDHIRTRFGYEARFSHFPILGLCARCAAALHRHEGGRMTHDDPDHEQVHAHEHQHGEVAHTHPHAAHDHEHTEHDHEHRHGDRVHSHPHLHEQGLEDEHAHEH